MHAGDAAHHGSAEDFRREVPAAVLILAAILAAWIHLGQRPGLPGDGRGPVAAKARGLLDVNTATAVELASLPGIGPVLAQRIVEDRGARGPFRSVEDLDRVRGVGPQLVRRIAGLAVAR